MRYACIDIDNEIVYTSHRVRPPRERRIYARIPYPPKIYFYYICDCTRIYTRVIHFKRYQYRNRFYSSPSRAATGTAASGSSATPAANLYIIYIRLAMRCKNDDDAMFTLYIHLYVYMYMHKYPYIHVYVSLSLYIYTNKYYIYRYRNRFYSSPSRAATGATASGLIATPATHLFT